MKSNCVQSFMQMVASQTSGEAGTKPSHTLAMAQPCQRQASALLGHTRTSIRPQAILEVVRRRGRSWGLLAQYEEARLGVKR